MNLVKFFQTAYKVGNLVPSKPNSFSQIGSIRHNFTKPRRFYKKTGILESNGSYEITLDQKKLKTPKGAVLKVENEPLALAVAAEWDAQQGEINRASMHLTSLCNTSQDNPNFITKSKAVDDILNFLDTDAILYHSHSEEVYEMQKKEWLPVTNWFQKNFKVDVEPSRDLEGPKISDETKKVIENHLLKYNLPAIHGFLMAVETLKSVILTLSCVERKITSNQAVLLSRLEEEYQANKWGRVEWAHTISQYDLQARVAAAIMFIHLNSLSESTKATLLRK